MANAWIVLLEKDEVRVWRAGAATLRQTPNKQMSRKNWGNVGGESMLVSNARLKIYPTNSMMQSNDTKWYSAVSWTMMYLYIAKKTATTDSCCAITDALCKTDRSVTFWSFVLTSSWSRNRWWSMKLSGNNWFSYRILFHCFLEPTNLSKSSPWFCISLDTISRKEESFQFIIAQR